MGTAFHNAAAASETVALPAVTATAQSTPTASTAAVSRRPIRRSRSIFRFIRPHLWDNL